MIAAKLTWPPDLDRWDTVVPTGTSSPSDISILDDLCVSEPKNEECTCLDTSLNACSNITQFLQKVLRSW